MNKTWVFLKALSALWMTDSEHCRGCFYQEPESALLHLSVSNILLDFTDPSRVNSPQFSLVLRCTLILKSGVNWKLNLWSWHQSSTPLFFFFFFTSGTQASTTKCWSATWIIMQCNSIYFFPELNYWLIPWQETPTHWQGTHLHVALVLVRKYSYSLMPRSTYSLRRWCFRESLILIPSKCKFLKSNDLTLCI